MHKAVPTFQHSNILTPPELQSRRMLRMRGIATEEQTSLVGKLRMLLRMSGPYTSAMD